MIVDRFKIEILTRNGMLGCHSVSSWFKKQPILVNFFTSPRYSRSRHQRHLLYHPCIHTLLQCEENGSTIHVKKSFWTTARRIWYQKTSERIRPEHSSLMMWPMK